MNVGPFGVIWRNCIAPKALETWVARGQVCAILFNDYSDTPWELVRVWRDRYGRWGATFEQWSSRRELEEHVRNLGLTRMEQLTLGI